MYSDVQSRSGFHRLHSKPQNGQLHPLQDFPTLLASWPFNGATDVMALVLDEQSGSQCWGATVHYIEVIMFDILILLFHFFSTANTVQPCFKVRDYVYRFV